mmetsp:Transcript_97973/g.158002  ORF Transcript_97973/g.158002 Transcript_97973/m.158002 type:complete len:120 (+) Transcript_97973:976-1335(+)
MRVGRDAAGTIVTTASSRTARLPGSVPGDVTTLAGGLAAGIVVMATCAGKQTGIAAHHVDCNNDGNTGGTTDGTTDAITTLDAGTVCAAGRTGKIADVDGPGATYVALVELAATTAVRT